MLDSLVTDYSVHKENPLYTNYMDLLTKANINEKGEPTMICEGILNLCGTSSKEIEERTMEEATKIYLPQIQQLTAENKAIISENKAIISENKTITSENLYLKQLLTQHGIAF